ncbi:MAG: LLM class flavin-dependent oxidoreductase [bacterium]|nr:LLM class flavin-dependent oxidoreductase [bacterium]
MHIDALLIPVDTTYAQMRTAAVRAEELGFSGIWTWDHVNATPFDGSKVLDCWTSIAALSEATNTITVGSMVTNINNRHPGVLANIIATAQDIASGRIAVGIGTGNGPKSPYSLEHSMIGVDVGTDAARRGQLAAVVRSLREQWSGATPGFPSPDPVPPIIVGLRGPKLAAVAGEVADGIDFRAGLDNAVEIIRAAKSAADEPESLQIIAHTSPGPDWMHRESPAFEDLRQLGVERLIFQIKPPYLADLSDMARII